VNELPEGMIPVERTLVGTLGIEVVEVTDETVRGRLPVEDRVRQPYGIVHGGAIAALAESITSMGTARGVMAEQKLAMGQEINASFMRPITNGHVNALARVRRRGRTAWNWDVEVTDDDGRLCALLRATIAVRDAPERPFAPGSSG
jgi:1,4-dihydroxy-2-naphthoyl-CoA hydrolase